MADERTHATHACDKYGNKTKKKSQNVRMLFAALNSHQLLGSIQFSFFFAFRRFATFALTHRNSFRQPMTAKFAETNRRRIPLNQLAPNSQTNGKFVQTNSNRFASSHTRCAIRTHTHTQCFFSVLFILFVDLPFAKKKIKKIPEISSD